MQITFEEGSQLPPAANISHVTCKRQSDCSMVRLCRSELFSVGFFCQLMVCCREAAVMGTVEWERFRTRFVVEFGDMPTDSVGALGEIHE